MNSKIKVTCNGCGKEFEKWPCRLGTYNFCCQSCYLKWQRGKEKLTKRKRQKLAGEQAKLITCSYCGKQFSKILSARMLHNFCSKECYIKWRREVYGWQPGEIRICKYCGKEFSEYAAHIKIGDGIFCSMECKASWQHENIVGPKHPQWTRIERTCEICGKTFFIKPSHLGYKCQGRYCSLKCMGEARRIQKLKQWQDPEYREETIKRSLKGLFKRPTSLEKQFIKLTDEYQLPYKYTGDGSFLIGFKNPDFVNVNGAKVCIEVAEPYFHKPSYAKKRTQHFAKYGWKCYVFFSQNGKLNKEEVLKKVGAKC